ncbi:MAG: LuxR C-terminal-related transcriptional regulator, partial [Chloroflexota bacterium]
MSSLIQVNEQVAASMWSHEDQYVLKTKLFLAPPRIPIVARPHLVEMIHTSLHYPLTVIVAPAGSGKTTLLSEWVHATNIPTAFVSLDSGDNDPTRFWTYIMVALRHKHSQIDAIIQNMVQVVQPTPIETILTELINTLCEITQDCVLILDDYQVIDNPDIHTAMNFFIEHLPPHVHLIVATRTTPPFPMAKLRVDGALNEITGDDLIFSEAEIHTFFAKRSGIELDVATLAELSTRTEGWVAGVHLAALILKQTDDISACVGRFGGHHQMITDYLITEVLHQQPDGVQQFLLETSMLQRLNGPLCDAIAGRADSQSVLEQLHQANLFLIPLDDDHYWYRYHHLFAQTLRMRMERQFPEQAKAIHLCASLWYAEAGDIAEAVHHALAGHAWEQATHLIVTQGPQYCLHGGLQTIQRWLNALPVDIVNHHPQLALLQAWVPLLTGQFELLNLVEPQLELIEQILTTDAVKTHNVDPAMIQGEILAMRASVALAQGHTSRAMHLCREASILRQQQQHVWWYDTLISLNLADAAFYLNDIALAQQNFTYALKASQATHNRPIELYARYGLAVMSFVQGYLYHTAKQFEDILQYAKQYKLDTSAIVGRTNIFLGRLYYEWNNLDRAAPLLRHGITITEQIGEIMMARFGGIWLTRVQYARQDMDSADSAFQETHRLARKEGIHGTGAFDVHQVAIWLTQGKLGYAIQWAQTCNIDPNGEINYLSEFGYTTLTRVWIAQKYTGRARHLLTRLRQYAEDTGRVSLLIRVLVQEVLAYYYEHDQESATQTLACVLQLTESEGYQRTFFDEGQPMYRLLQMMHNNGWQTDFVKQLLNTFPASALPDLFEQQVQITTSSAIPALPAPTPYPTSALSNRELEVLRLVAQGHTNAGIARELTVTENSIKTYLRRIYRKLGVRN